MEGAHEGVPLDLAAVAEMRAEMGTEGAGDVRVAVLGAKQHEVFAEEEERPYVAGGEVRGFGQYKPAERNRQVRAVPHGLVPRLVPGVCCDGWTAQLRVSPCALRMAVADAINGTC